MYIFDMYALYKIEWLEKSIYKFFLFQCPRAFKNVHMQISCVSLPQCHFDFFYLQRKLITYALLEGHRANIILYLEKCFKISGQRIIENMYMENENTERA